MSRHDFEHQDSTTGTHYEITVGWDRPLQTFFAQVFAFPEGKSTASKPVLWTGLDLDQHPDPKAVLEAVSEYFPIPEGLAQTLEADRLATLHEKDGPAQIYLKALLNRSR